MHDTRRELDVINVYMPAWWMCNQMKFQHHARHSGEACKGCSYHVAPLGADPKANEVAIEKSYGRSVRLASCAPYQVALLSVECSMLEGFRAAGAKVTNEYVQRLFCITLRAS